MTDVTRILNAIEQRDAGAADELLPLLIVHAGIAQVHERLVGTDSERQTDQDWSQGVVRHSWYVIFQKAEVMVSKSLFHEILDRIIHLKPVAIGFG